MTESVVSDLLARREELDPGQKTFLEKIVRLQQEFAADVSDDAESLLSAADGQAGVGSIQHRLGRLPESVHAFREALKLYGLHPDTVAVAPYICTPHTLCDALVRRLRAGDLRDVRIDHPASLSPWCEPDVLRRLRRASLAALRKEVEPAEQAALGRFLPPLSAWLSIRWWGWCRCICSSHRQVRIGVAGLGLTDRCINRLGFPGLSWGHGDR